MVKNHTDAIDAKYMPTVFTGWDTTPRHQKRGTILKDFDLATFKRHLATIKQTLVKRDVSNKIIIIKSWNEWAEGNLLEPDSIFGYQLLEAYSDFTTNFYS